MHDVEQHINAHFMRAVDQIFQIVGRSVPAARGEEIADLIAERRIIGVLHDRHQLNRIVAERLNARENLIGEFAIGADARFLLRHADVRFVNQHRRGFVLFIAAVRPGERRFRLPDYALESERLRILARGMDVRRNAIELFIAARNFEQHA